MAIAIKTKKRLKTIKSLNSIFNALQVITIARLQKIRSKHSAAQRYLAGIREIAGQLDLPQAGEKGKTLAILVSANRGFCGCFNMNLLYRAQSFIGEPRQQGLEFLVFGRKGSDFLRARKQTVRDSFLKEEYDFEFFARLSGEIVADHQKGKISEVQIISNRFRTLVRQDAVAERLIPVESAGLSRSDRYLIEPDRETLAGKIFEQLLSAEIYFSYLDSLLGESSARMITLKNAIENSEDLIGELVVAINKDRQQSITSDLLEIIGSYESLKGARLN